MLVGRVKHWQLLQEEWALYLPNDHAQRIALARCYNGITGNEGKGLRRLIAIPRLAVQGCHETFQWRRRRCQEGVNVRDEREEVRRPDFGQKETVR